MVSIKPNAQRKTELNCSVEFSSVSRCALGLTVDTAKHFIIPIETLFDLKDLPFLFIRQHKLWNDAQLIRVAMITRFSWYFAANISVF